MKKKFTDEHLIGLFIATQQPIYFTELYRRYRPKVLRYCLPFVGGDACEAEDLTQDIFIRLLTRLDSFSGRAQFSTWLYTLSRNYCTDKLRISHKKEKGIAEYCAELINPDVLYNYRNDNTSADEQLYYLRLALEKLPDWEQQLLIRKYQQGLPTRLIAHLEKRNLSAVKMRLLRARKHLRHAYMQAFVSSEVTY